MPPSTRTYEPGQRVRVHTPDEPALHGRFARVVERAPAPDHWRCLMLDQRDWPKGAYDWAFRWDEIRPAAEGRRPTAPIELRRFITWLEGEGIVLARDDLSAVFYFGRAPLVKFIDDGEDSVVDRYVREHY